MKKRRIDNLYGQLIKTAENTGLKILSDERCCQLMVWLLEIGGYTEESTHNVKLREDIFAAQKRLNLLGGETPNIELLPILKGFHKEILSFIKEENEKPLWLVELEKYYKIMEYNRIAPNK